MTQLRASVGFEKAIQTYFPDRPIDRILIDAPEGDPASYTEVLIQFQDGGTWILAESDDDGDGSISVYV